ncbi:MAG: DUF58 domain-containing protein [Anaerolineales bacterium]|nr:DUF58 domain-containing protein [Anaerolineales bacterium]MCB9145487.1 DUF58 domain-containing protein [Anaerolineales bacterium]
MNRIVLLAILIYIVLLAGIATLNGDVIGLALPLVLYLLAGLWRAPDELNLTAERTLSEERISPGGIITVTLAIKNHGAALEQIRFSDPLPKFLEVIGGSSDRLVSIPAGGEFTWSYTVRGKRGSHTFKGIEATTSDILGLMKKRAHLSAPGQVLVLPGLVRVRHISILPRQTRVYSGNIPANQGGTGIDFFGVREYQIGDSPRHVNWRVSARQSNILYSNEYQQERVADVGIVLDGRHSLNVFGHDMTIFEESVKAAVAVSTSLLAEGNRVGLFVYGKRSKWTSPGYGKYQRERIMHALAQAETGEDQSFKSLTIPRRLFPPDSLIILISPLAGEDLKLLGSLRARGYQLLVISPDPVSFETRGLPQSRSVELAQRILRLQRETMLRELRHIGIQVVNWDVSIPFEQIAQSTLSRPAAWMHSIRRGVR